MEDSSGVTLPRILCLPPSPLLCLHSSLLVYDYAPAQTMDTCLDAYIEDSSPQQLHILLYALRHTQITSIR